MLTRAGSIIYNPPPATTNNTPLVDSGITSVAQLQMVSTQYLVTPVLKLWINAADGTFQAWTLQADGAGLQPNDFNAANPKSWYKNGT